MALADRYLCDGEQILAVLPGSPLLRDRELAATDRRIICVRPDGFYDVGYHGLSSLGCDTLYKPAWAYAAFVLAGLSIIYLGMVAGVPDSIPFGPFSISLEWLVSLIRFPGIVCGVMAMATAAVFLVSVQRGVIMRASGRTFIFGFGRERRDQAAAFVKTARTACGRNR